MSPATLYVQSLAEVALRSRKVAPKFFFKRTLLIDGPASAGGGWSYTPIGSGAVVGVGLTYHSQASSVPSSAKGARPVGAACAL